MSTFRVFHTNIRSINKNFDEFRVVLSEVEDKFDIIVLSETWQIPDLSLYKLDNYNVLYNSGDINQNDGVVVYIKKQLNYEHETKNIDNIRVLEVNTEYDKQSVLISAIYRPPSTCQNTFVEHFNNYLEHSKKNVDMHILLGDINLDILKHDDRIVHEYLNYLCCHGFLSAINKPTRVQESTRTCIDHIFIKDNCKNNSVNSIVYETCITDHYSVLIEVFKAEKTNNGNNSKRFKNIFKKDKFTSEVGKVNWNVVYLENDINLASDRFVSTLKNCAETSTGRVKIKKKELKRKEWITRGLVNSVNRKKKLYEIMVKNPTEVNKNTYKNYKRWLSKLIDKTKKEYYQNLINQNQNVSSNLWNCMSKLTKNESGDTKEIKEIKLENGNLTSKKQEMSEVFVKHFTEIGQNMANKIKQNQNNFQNFSAKRLPNSLVLLQTDIKEIKNEILKLSNKKAPGLDALKSENLKLVVDEISPPLTYIFNWAIRIGVFPDVFKTALIKPLFKGGDKTSVNSYRPISLISNLAKIFERILKTRICNFLTKYNVLSDGQFGFREARSTEDAIVQLTSKISKFIDTKIPTLCVFVDLAKAFDTVDHGLLLDVLERVGFRGAAYTLLESYLNNRKQRVAIQDSISNERIVTYGVPQGTVLGPILFNLYLNDIFNLEVVGDVISFADDTAILYSAPNWKALKQTTENDLKKIFDFFNKRLLTVNVGKTYYMPFTSYSSYLPDYDCLDINYNSELIRIQAAAKLKYLGIIIDPHLKWGDHITFIIKKLRFVLYKIKYVKNLLEPKQLKILYHSLVESHLQYGTAAWGAATKNHIIKVEILQKLIMRVMFNLPFSYPTDALYQESRLLDIRQLFFVSCVKRQFKNKNELEKINHFYNTRHRETSYSVPRTAKSLLQRNYFYLGPKLYNILPSELKGLHSFGLFKKRLIQWIAQLPRIQIHQYVDFKNTYIFH